jgi:exopolysaccharide biosynthesis polyprenyl glycosylphosphotransferase
VVLVQAALPEPRPEAKEGAAPAFYKRRRRREDEIGQVLLRLGYIKPEQLREALRIQVESGGHVGAILIRLGACDSRAIAEALIEQVRLTRDKGKRKSAALRARENPSFLGLTVSARPVLTLLLLMGGDFLAASFGASLVFFVAHGGAPWPSLFGVGILVPLCLAAYLAIDLYSTTPPSAPMELRNLSVGTSFAYFGLWGTTLLDVGTPVAGIPAHAWLLGWFATLVGVPVARGMLRSRFASREFWGEPVVVLGAGKLGRTVVTALRRRPQLGLKPVAILDDDKTKHGTVRVAWGEDDIVVEPVSERFGAQGLDSSHRAALEQFSEVEGVPIVGGLELAPVLAQRLGIRTAVFSIPEMEASDVLGVIERVADSYTNVLVIPDQFNLAHFGAPTKHLDGMLGIEVQRRLLLKWPRVAKRALDLSFTLVGSLFLLPFLLIIAVLIKLDSRGSVFYAYKRLGQDGVRFMSLKFRTMYGDGERRLAEVLAADERLRLEYEQFHKLVVDPRVTRIGRFLRKYSLDELPQLWNVIVGDMSLVGPRPYLEREISDMEGKEAIVLRVKPGLTGIWQVTERNASTFERRVALDVEYVRNWSPWLDLYVLARTVPVVLGGTGS